MYCPNCGKENPDQSYYCTGCGYSLKANAPTAGNRPPEPKKQEAPYGFRSKWLAFGLCILFGWIGIHRFYVGKIGTGIVWALTFGCFGLGWFMDLLGILCGGFRDKNGYPLM